MSLRSAGHSSKTSMASMSGFESHFTDLTQMGQHTAQTHAAKKPRTSSYVKPQPQTPKAAKPRAMPLQFTFKSKNTASQIVQETTNRWVAKPQLVSQVTTEDDWGDDGDDADLLIAASQVDETLVSGDLDTAQEDLMAMTALMEEEDCFFDDIEEVKDGAGERLNQTLTVWAEPPKTQNTNDFKTPFPQTVVHEPKDSRKQEEEKLRRLNMKYQGETSFLREQLKKKESEIESERVRRRNLEAEIKDQMEVAQKNKDAEVSAVKTEKMFILQEVQQLKDKVKKLEGVMETKTISKSSPVLTQPQTIKQETEYSIVKKEFTEVKPKICKVSDAETQTRSTAGKRKGRLSRPLPSISLSSRSLCSVASVRTEDKSRVLLASSESLLQAEVGRIIKEALSAIRLLEKEMMKEVVFSNLKVLEHLLSSCGSMVSTHQRSAITEVCSDLLSSSIETKTGSILPHILSLLVETWSPVLLEPDITSYVLSLLSRFVTCVPLPASSHMFTSFFTLLGRVSEDEQQASLLCKQSQDECFLSCVSALIYKAENSLPLVQETASLGLSHWVLTASCLVPLPPYLSVECGGCSSCLVFSLTHLAKVSVRRLLALSHDNSSRPRVVSCTKDCLLALYRLQDAYRCATDGEDTAWLNLINYGARLQRTYMWTMEQAQVFTEELGEDFTWRLTSLALEQNDTVMES